MKNNEDEPEKMEVEDDESFVLSAVFKSSSVVRCVRACYDGSFVAGRSDCVVKRYKFDAVHGKYDDTYVDVHVPDSVETLLPLRPGQVKNCPEGGFVVATLERTLRKSNMGAPIRVYNATGTQIQELKGHTNYVRSLAFNGDSEIISGSFDGTAKRWSLDEKGSCVETLKANHEGCVSCVMGVPGSSRIITGSSGSKVENGRSNAKLRVWECVASGSVLKGTPKLEHSDNVRGLALLGNTGLFASCSNDGTIMIRTLGDGSVVKSIDMPNHPALNRMSLVYDIVQYGNTIVSISDDQCLRLWNCQSGDCDHVLQHPRDLTSVTVLGNGDIVTADWGGTIRVWTRDRSRRASDETIREFEENMKAAAKSTKVDPLSCPPWEDRVRVPGKDGAIKMFRVGLNEVWLANYDGGEWKKTGEVQNVKRHEKQKLGDEWFDEILSLDLPGNRVVPVGFNYTDNPVVIADKVMEKHGLPEAYRVQIRDFIRQHQLSKGFDFARDEERRRNAKKLPCFASFPADTAMLYEKANVEGMRKKILEFNESITEADLKMNPAEIKKIEVLTETLMKTSYYHATKLSTQAATLMLRKLTKWPISNLFVVVDLLRVVMTHPYAHLFRDAVNSVIEVFVGAFKDDKTLNSIEFPAKQQRILKILTLRLLSNMFATVDMCKSIVHTPTKLHQVLNVVSSYLLHPTDKTFRQTAATCLLNMTYALTSHFDKSMPKKIAETLVTQLFALGVKGLENSRNEDDKKSLNDLYFHRVATCVGTLLVSENSRPLLFGHPDLKFVKSFSIETEKRGLLRDLLAVSSTLA